MRNDKPFDEILKQAVANKYDESIIPIPDPDQTWNRIEETLRKEFRRKKNYFIMKRLGGIAAAVVVIVALAITPQTSTAFSKLFQVIDEWKDDVIHIITKSRPQEGKAITPPPPPSAEGMDEIVEGASTSSKVVSLEVAKDNVSIPIIIPNFPETLGYSLVKVIIWPYSDGRKSDEIYLDYEGNHVQFSIIQERLGDHFVRNRTVVGSDYEEIMVGEYPGILIFVNDEITNLEWIANGIVYKIFGNLTKDEIMAITEFMK